MITADQLALHALGDYVLQSDWIATTKTKKSVAALAHVVTYTLPFLLVTRSPAALAVILVTHFLIDRWRLARYVVWAKNFIGPWMCKFEKPVALAQGLPPPDAENINLVWTWYRRWNPPWAEVKDSFGYPKDRPVWLAMWLMIIVDNLMHVVCNGLALKYLGGL